MAARVSNQMNARTTTSQAAPEKRLAPRAARGRRCLLPRAVLQEQMLRSSPSLGLFWGMAQPPQKHLLPYAASYLSVHWRSPPKRAQLHSTNMTPALGSTQMIFVSIKADLDFYLVEGEREGCKLSHATIMGNMFS